MSSSTRELSAWPWRRGTRRVRRGAASHCERAAYWLGALALLVARMSSNAAAQSPAEWEVVDARLGFNDRFKLGCWTELNVMLAGGGEPFTGYLEAIVSDADGVPVVYRTSEERPVGLTPRASTNATLVVRVGRHDSIEVRFRSASDDKIRARRTFRFAYERGDGEIPYGQAGTSRILLAIGPHEVLSEVVRSEAHGDSDEYATRIVALAGPADLPLAWEAYEGVDVVVISAGETAFFRGLAPDSPRCQALYNWLHNGGRLVVLGSDQAQETLRADGALASVLPGRFVDMAPLRDSTPLEAFSNSNESISRGRFDVRAPRLDNLVGEVLASGKSQPDDLPLVVRARQGVGEVTFCAIDPHHAPFQKWSGRQSLMRRLLGWPLVAPGNQSLPPAGQSQSDMCDLLTAALDREFVGVKTTSFGFVALLVIAYIALIGPGDFLLVKRVLRRMEATWITFPLIVSLVSLGAYALARSYKGDQLRVNQVEIVDIDMADGTARGAVWTHYFSPKVDRYRLTLAPRMGASEVSDVQTLAAWMGSPGQGLGGMRGEGGGNLFDRGYRCESHRDGLTELPVQEWSTKTLFGRWQGHVEQGIEGELLEVRDGLLSGTIVNRTGIQLEDCVLMHGDWAYRLTTLADGAEQRITENDQPRKVKTLLTNAAAGEDPNVRTADDGTVALGRGAHDVARLVKVMMFYEAVGGRSYAAALNRYHGFVDMSRLLEGNQAILMARAPAEAGTTWLNKGNPLTSPQDRRWVYYRFIIPLQSAPHGS